MSIATIVLSFVTYSFGIGVFVAWDPIDAEHYEIYIIWPLVLAVPALSERIVKRLRTRRRPPEVPEARVVERAAGDK